MLEEEIKALFDVELVRCWNLDGEGNAIEEEVEIEEPEIEVSIQGDSQCYWFLFPELG
jgi:hypothetical protein